MAIPSTPIINKPYGTGTSTNVLYSTNVILQSITGTFDANTQSILQNGVTTGITVNLTDLTWALDISLLSGENVFLIHAVGIDGSLSNTATLTIYLVEDGSLGFLVEAPTGISVNRYNDRVKILLTHSEDVQSNPTELITGFNFYASTNPGGGLSGYTLLNTNLVVDYDEYYENVIDTTETTDRTETTPIVETVTKVSTIEYLYKYAYSHVRNKGSTDSTYPQRDEAKTIFETVPNTQEIYYVVTAIAYDPDMSVEYESTYSSELVGLPIVLSTRIKDLTPRTLNTIQQDLISEILRVQSNIDIRPGSVTRDIHVDPPAWEANRIWFILDFVSRSQSFLTLLQIDDPNSTGVSVLVSESKYKQALGKALSLTDSEVQNLIDQAFEKLAMNSLTSRQGLEKATGSEVLQRLTAPNQDIVIPIATVFQSRSKSGVSTSFISTITKTMTASQSSSYYNVSTGYYEISVPIEASVEGVIGNVAAGSITSASISGFSKVTNRVATSFGRDKESNLSLAERAMLCFVSVDSGTGGGYLRTALDTSGVHRARIVEAGETLMQRDWDDVREKHIGGKVDVWIQGTSLVEESETFAFEYNQELNIRFLAVGEASNLTFRTTSINVTELNPLFSMLNNSDVGYGLRNISKGEDFDLTGVTIIDYRTIQLDIDRPQPDVSEDDIIQGDYKYRKSDPFIPLKQPVNSVSSIISTSSTLTPDNYSLVKIEDPLLFGYSVEASDEINIVQANGVPTGESNTIVDEQIVLIGTSEIPLASVGVDKSTIIVKNLSGTITYISDITDSVSPDYYITPGTLTTPPKIARSSSGNILNGQKVLVSYTAEENFTVTYSVNNVLQLVSSKIDKKRHVTADVLVKQSIENSVEMAFTVVLKNDSDQADIDKQIRTNLSYLVNRLQIGQDLHQSDVVHAIKEVPEVSYVIQPLTRMHKSDGSLILRNALDSDSIKVVEGQVANVWLLTQGLSFKTSMGGGSNILHRGVFKDEQPLTLYTQGLDFNELRGSPNSALIIGSDGIYIPGFTTPEDQVSITANRVFVSLPLNDTPDNYTWSASYITDGESGTTDIESFVMESLTLGEVVIEYTTTSDVYGNDF